MQNIVSLRFDIDNDSFFANCFQNTPLQISKKVASIDNLSAQSTLSKQPFRIPLNDDLINIIGDVTDISQQAKINLNKRIKGSILINDVERYKGSFQFIQCFNSFNTDRKEAEFLFNGDEVDVRNILSQIKMSDLLEGETIPYNATEIALNFSINPDFYTENTRKGYYWPFIDYGQRFTADTTATSGTIIGFGQTVLNQTDFKPAVNIEKCLINNPKIPFKITATDSGDGNIYEEFFKRQYILLHNNESKIPALTTSPKDYTGYLGISVQSGYLLASNVPGATINFDTVTVYNQNTFNVGLGRYEPPVSGLYTIRVSGTIRLVALNNINTELYTLTIVALNDAIGNFNLVTAYNRVLSSNSDIEFYIDKTFTVDTFPMNYIRLRISQGNPSNNDLNAFILPDFRFEVVSTPEVNQNSEVDVSASSPDLTAWDILKTTIIQTNSIIETLETGDINIKPFNQWIKENNENIFIDQFVDNSKDIQIRPYSIQGAKSIELKYESDEDIYNENYKKIEDENYGTLKIENTGTDATERKVSLSIPFAASPLSYIDNTSFPIIKLFDSEGNLIKGKPRLINTYSSSDSKIDFSFNIEDSVNNNFAPRSISKYPYVGHWEIRSGIIGGYNTNDYNFGQSLSFFRAEGYPNNNLFERFWKNYINETYSEGSREIALSIRMPLAKVEKLKFNENFYYKGVKCRLTQYDNLSLINREPFTVKLMKRLKIQNIDIAPFYPFDVIDGIVQWKNSLDNQNLVPPDGSSANQTDLENSCIAYGFFYDSNEQKGNQRGIILEI